MILQRTFEENDSSVMLDVLARSEGMSGFGDLGFNWLMAMEVVGWIAQGIRLGKGLWESMRGAADQIPADQKLDQQDVSTVADQLSKQFPTTSKSQWEQLLNQGLADKVVAPPIPPPCPAGYTRDPITGACVELKKAGMGIPTWGWIAIAGIGLLMLPKLGILG